MALIAEVPSSVSGASARGASAWVSVSSRMASVFQFSEDDSVDMAEASSPEQHSEVATTVRPQVEVHQANAQELRPLKPASRGTRHCWCHGEVLAMFGHYGWVAPSQPIDHPARSKNNCRIYLHKCDVEGDLTLVEGDQVSFYLYVDDQGLGAEGCCLRGWSPEQACAAQMKSVAPQVSDLNPLAAEFVPFGRSPAVSARPLPVHGANPYNVFVINEAYWDWSDFSDDDDDESTGIANSESDCDGDVESSCEHARADNRSCRKAKQQCGFDGNSSRVARKAKSAGVRSCDSDSTGFSSDSDTSNRPIPDGTGVLPPLNSCPPPGLMHPGIRAPPGLSLL